MQIELRQRGQGFDGLTRQIERQLATAMRKTAKPVEKAAIKAFKAATPSHFGKSKTGASYPLKFKAQDVVATAQSLKMTLQASPVGFWVMLESGAKPHKITARNKRALSWGSDDDSVARSVDHPGFAGKGSYSKGEAAAIRAVEDTIDDTLVATITRGIN